MLNGGVILRFIFSELVGNFAIISERKHSFRCVLSVSTDIFFFCMQVYFSSPVLHIVFLDMDWEQ